ncbi:MAG: DUF2062 domain-containing protein [Planctomycetes bacterium]|nr:DUF2062 domain-containing protein [Planctomycetota bacterium]
MVDMESVFVVIPVYNHPEQFREIVERCLAAHPHVLVVDDGSDQPVSPILEDIPVQVLRHKENLGKGKALRTAAAYVQEQGGTHMITVDADAQHYPEDIGQFLEEIRLHPEALILGVRDFAGAEVPYLSRFGRSFGNFWVRVQTGVPVKDIQSGFRAYPVFLFEQLKCLGQRYDLEVEIVVRTLWAGVSVTHVPVRVYYPPKKQRISHYHKLRDNLRLSLLNTHLTIRAFVPWPHCQAGCDNNQTKVTVWHPVRSIRLLLTERATPRELAWAVALGIFLGALPLIACHTLFILIAAAFLRLNRVTAVAASQLCMPPVVPALCIEMGYYMRFGRFLTLKGLHTLHDVTFLELGHMGIQRLWEWLLGSMVVGVALALLLGFLTYVVALAVDRRSHVN